MLWMMVGLSRIQLASLQANLSVEQEERGNGSGGTMSGKSGRYRSTRTDSPPALSAAAILQLLAVWSISGKRGVLSTRGDVEGAEK